MLLDSKVSIWLSVSGRKIGLASLHKANDVIAKLKKGEQVPDVKGKKYINPLKEVPELVLSYYARRGGAIVDAGMNKLKTERFWDFEKNRVKEPDVDDLPEEDEEEPAEEVKEQPTKQRASKKKVDTDTGEEDGESVSETIDVPKRRGRPKKSK